MAREQITDGSGQRRTSTDRRRRTTGLLGRALAAGMWVAAAEVCVYRSIPQGAALVVVIFDAATVAVFYGPTARALRGDEGRLRSLMVPAGVFALLTVMPLIIIAVLGGGL